MMAAQAWSHKCGEHLLPPHVASSVQLWFTIATTVLLQVPISSNDQVQALHC